MLFTFAIFSFVLAIISLFVATALTIEIAITIDIAITFAIDPFVFALWVGGSVAVEDDEERETDQPDGWF